MAANRGPVLKKKAGKQLGRRLADKLMGRSGPNKESGNASKKAMLTEEDEHEISLLDRLKLLREAEAVRRLGLHALSPRLPFGKAGTSLDDDLLLFEATLASLTIFRAMLGARQFEQNEGVLADRSQMRLFVGTVSDGVTVVTSADCSRLLGKHGRPAKVWKLLDKKGKGAITVDDVEHVVESVFLRRRALISTLYGQQAPLAAAGLVINLVVGFFVSLLALGAFDVDLVSLMVPMASLFLAGSFAFSSVLSDFVVSLHLMIFVHPYDVGDHVSFDHGLTVLTVEKVALMNTEFRELTGAAVYMQNAQIARMAINNNRRCEVMYCRWVYSVHSDVTDKQLDRIRLRLRAFCEASPRLYTTSDSVHIDEVPTDQSMLRAPSLPRRRRRRRRRLANTALPSPQHCAWSASSASAPAGSSASGGRAPRRARTCTSSAPLTRWYVSILAQHTAKRLCSAWQGLPPSLTVVLAAAQGLKWGSDTKISAESSFPFPVIPGAPAAQLPRTTVWPPP